MHKIMNTIPKRIGIVALAIGTLLLAIGLLQISGDAWSASTFFNKWGRVITLDASQVRRYPLALYGTYLVIAGLLLSVLYDAITGRVYRWG
ncbi:hypothetical protein HX773_25340, partial [Pantoea sp. B9002]|uniref:hypothetical protein n=1 Tax=Pantoea sp. B9002 TaxID=2726979 RepID=UPI0015A0B59F